ncbi:hypothetical protein FB45DRAFT_138662 [Roridomyces roridus]|uniref:Uncharacterized protein n=1 Tax=Roridomyces roridus TaxID=1738132 RepID=A0AAD7BHU7_9AGAR|nr:hypothetical protein FB45DRAFT_138662 [Roridomyces roridus]
MGRAERKGQKPMLSQRSVDLSPLRTTMSSLTGIVLCKDICRDVNAQDLYPETVAVIQQTMTALRRSTKAHQRYANIINDIAEKRGLDHFKFWRQEDVKKWFCPDVYISLVAGLKQEHEGWMWGCFPKSDVDRAKYGEGICLNGDIVQVLESKDTTPYLKDVCEIMLAITLAHEIMHLLNWLIFPEYRMERTPPGVGNSESGFELEARLFGGHIQAVWEEKAHQGQVRKIRDLSFRKKGWKPEDPDALLKDSHLEEWTRKLAEGELIDFSSFDDVHIYGALPTIHDPRAWASQLSSPIGRGSGFGAHHTSGRVETRPGLSNGGSSPSALESTIHI